MILRYNRPTNEFVIMKDGKDVLIIAQWQALILYMAHGLTMLEAVKMSLQVRLAENSLELINRDITVNGRKIPTNVSSAYFSCL